MSLIALAFNSSASVGTVSSSVFCEHAGISPEEIIDITFQGQGSAAEMAMHELLAQPDFLALREAMNSPGRA